MIDIPNQADAVIRITSTRTCLPVAPSAAWAATHELVARLWPTHTVVAEPPRLLIHSVGGDHPDDPDGWLTWTLDALTADNTAVTVTFSEPHDGAPSPELDLLLCRLVAHVLSSPRLPAAITHPACTEKELT